MKAEDAQKVVAQINKVFDEYISGATGKDVFAARELFNRVVRVIGEQVEDQPQDIGQSSSLTSVEK